MLQLDRAGESWNRPLSRADAATAGGNSKWPIWVSVGGFAVAEYADLCDRLDDRPDVEAIELNVSCPNVDDVPASVGEIVAASRAATRKPLYNQALTGHGGHRRGRPCRPEGGHGRALARQHDPRPRSRRADPKAPPLPRRGRPLWGGAQPIALAAVYACYEATGLPIVGWAVSPRGRDALELLAAGAASVALGTILFADPGAPARIRAELASEIANLGVGEIDNAIGLAHAEPAAISKTAGRSAAMSVQ